MIIAKIHIHHGRKILAVCDKNLLGKKLAEGKLQLDLASQFYNGYPATEKELIELLKEVYTINAVGKNSVAILLKYSIVSKNNISRIKGIPFANVLLE